MLKVTKISTKNWMKKQKVTWSIERAKKRVYNETTLKL